LVNQSSHQSADSARDAQKDKTMKWKPLAAIAIVLLALAACVIAPYDGERSDHYRGDHEYGRPVWRG
jgi:hypothetical protein